MKVGRKRREGEREEAGRRDGIPHKGRVRRRRDKEGM